MNYCTIQDLIDLWRPLTEAEQTQAEQLIEIVSSQLRIEAWKRNRDVDRMIAEHEDMAAVVKSVVVDVVKRYINDNSVSGPAVSQMTQSAGGYSVTGTFLVPGGGVFIKNNELAKLGLLRARVGVIDLCG